MIDRPQFARCGITKDEVRGMVDRREIVQVLPCVYRSRATPDSPDGRDWAAVLWSGGVLSHRSAARWWQLPVPPADRVHVTVADRRFRGRERSVRVHRVPLPERETTECFDVPTTTKQRTTIDLLRTEPYPLARDLRDRAIQLGWIGPHTIARSVTEQLGRTGNTQLRLLVDEVVAGAQAESERLFQRILRRGGITGWVAQYPVRAANRTRYIDVALPEFKIAIEIDGREFHGDWSNRFDDDRARQNDLIAAGWRVLRFTWAHLQDPATVISRIVQLYAARRRRKLHNRRAVRGRGRSTRTAPCRAAPGGVGCAAGGRCRGCRAGDRSRAAGTARDSPCR
jgi:very-short-patch-repair endonuclease